jgi:hypothetical protein
MSWRSEVGSSSCRLHGQQNESLAAHSTRVDPYPIWKRETWEECQCCGGEESSILTMSWPNEGMQVTAGSGSVADAASVT